MNGLTIGIIGLALTAILCGVGSALGLKYTGAASAGVLAEDPKKFSKIIVLALLPATQGLYGFVIAIMGMANLPAATISMSAATALGDLAVITEVSTALAQGWAVFGSVMPMAIVGCLSAVLQGKTSSSTIMAVGKKPEIGGKSILFPAMIEFYALLGLVVAIMLLGNM